jgi:hypothetical protein
MTCQPYNRCAAAQLRFAGDSVFFGWRDEMEQQRLPRQEQDRVPLRTTGGTARREGQNDAPAFVRGIA